MKEWARLRTVRSTEAVQCLIALLTGVVLCPIAPSTGVAVHHPLAALAVTAVQVPLALSVVAAPLLPAHSAATVLHPLVPSVAATAQPHPVLSAEVAVHAVAARSEEALVVAVHTEAVAVTSVDADKT